MKRPLFVTGLAYLFATRLAFLLDINDLLPVSAAAVLSAVLFFVLRERIRHTQVICAVFLAGALALAGYALYCSRVVAPINGLSGKTVVAEGLITEWGQGVKSFSYTINASLPEIPGTRSTFPLVVRSISPLEASAGDTVRFTVTLQEADTATFYQSRGFLLTGKNVQDLSIIPAGRFKYERALLRLRDKMSQNLYLKLTEESAGMIDAMVLGQKSNIPQDVSSAMSKAGTIHLLSISGLHLSILSGFMLKLFGKTRSGTLAALLVSLFFVLLVGFSASLLRSFVMTAIALCGGVISKRSDSLNSLGFSLILCCAVRPYWVLGWGLWLSAASTLGIVLFSASITEIIKKRFGGKGRFSSFVATAGGVSIAAYTFTLPLLLLMSGWISIVAPLANILISPFVALTIFGGIACAMIPGTPFIGAYIAHATEFATKFITSVSKTMSALPYAIIAIDESYLLIWLLGACAIVAYCIKCRADKQLTRYACALLAASLSLGSLSFEGANQNKVELITLSGCNCSILLRGKEAVILGAPDAYEISDLLRYLDFRGVREIPMVIASDCGDNISSGMIRLNENYRLAGILGPNDEVICETIRDALPNAQVYSGGYATVTALGKASISTDLIKKDIYVNIIGSNQGRIIKSKRDFTAPEKRDAIRIYNGGTMLLPENILPAFEPVGAYLYGESRVILG